MDEVYNAAERRHVKHRAKLAARFEKEIGGYTAHIMSTVNGRGWMYDLLESCHVFASSFDTNALSMAFNEGSRNVGLRVLASIMATAPDEYVRMMREKNERDHARRTPAATDTDPDDSADSTYSDAADEFNRTSGPAVADRTTVLVE